MFEGQSPFSPTLKDGAPATSRNGYGFYYQVTMGADNDAIGYFISQGTHHPVSTSDEMLSWFGRYSNAETSGVSTVGAGAIASVAEEASLPF